MFVVVQKVSDGWEGSYQHFLQSFVNRNDAEAYVEFLKEQYYFQRNNYEIVEKEPISFESTFQMNKQNVFELEFHMGYRNGKHWTGSTKPRVVVINNVDFPGKFTEDWKGRNEYNEMDYDKKCDLEQCYIELNLEIPCEILDGELVNDNAMEAAKIFVKMVEDKRVEGYDEAKMREWINSDGFIEGFLNNWKIRA